MLSQIDGQGIAGDCAGSSPAPNPTPNPTPGCSYGVSPGSQSVDVNGGDFDGQVTVNAGCNWSAQAGLPGFSILSGANGSGNGSFRYRAAANPGGARTGTVRVQNRTIQVRQDGTTAPVPVRADFSFSPNPCPLVSDNPSDSTRGASIKCSFNASGSEGQITNYSWRFNFSGSLPADPVNSPSQSVTNITLPCGVPSGTFNRDVTLTVSGPTGSDTVTKSVRYRKDSGC